MCFGKSLQCTNYKRSMLGDWESKVKKPKSVANTAQPKIFEPQMLEA